jgi:tagaturonate reductase
MILQFGAGNFLRGFADLIVHQLNLKLNLRPGKIVVIQSTGKDRANAINASTGKYHVAIQGLEQGKVIDETIEVASISHALHAGSQWAEIVEAGRHPDLKIILSNTTEAGLTLDPADITFTGRAPVSFPAKLLGVLIERKQANQPAPWIVPCELIESNADRLRDLVLEQAILWNTPDDLIAWIKHECRWVNTLVDRIVAGRPTKHPLLESDPLLISAEPFCLWAVETKDANFPLAQHPKVVTVSDITPYTLRKVRILNGAHSALVSHAMEVSGVKTVRDCVEHQKIGPWVEKLLFEEIVPVLEGRCDDPKGFACETLDRFRNPFLDHQLSAIALNHESKVAVRLQPTLEEFRQRFGKEPPLLSELLGPRRFIG